VRTSNRNNEVNIGSLIPAGVSIESPIDFPFCRIQQQSTRVKQRCVPARRSCRRKNAPSDPDANFKPPHRGEYRSLIPAGVSNERPLSLLLYPRIKRQYQAMICTGKTKLPTRKNADSRQFCNCRCESLFYHWCRGLKLSWCGYCWRHCLSL